MKLFSRLHVREISITRQVVSGEFSQEEAIMSLSDTPESLAPGVVFWLISHVLSNA
jgi:hypothetical protein